MSIVEEAGKKGLFDFLFGQLPPNKYRLTKGKVVVPEEDMFIFEQELGQGLEAIRRK